MHHNAAMPEHCYFCSEIRAGLMELPPEEAHHAASVMRVRVGDRILLFDGRGASAPATVREVRRRLVSVETDAAGESRPPATPRLVLHVSMPKAARQHLLIEKCTELGVSAIQPLLTDRGVAKPSAGADHRWRRFAIEAAKQARQWWLPEFLAAQSLAESLDVARAGGLCLIASLASAARPLGDLLLDGGEPAQEVHVWIGPEGGFTPHESAMAAAAGLIEVSLGPSILRVETAAIAVCALVRLLRA